MCTTCPELYTLQTYSAGTMNSSINSSRSKQALMLACCLGFFLDTAIVATSVGQNSKSSDIAACHESTACHHSLLKPKRFLMSCTTLDAAAASSTIARCSLASPFLISPNSTYSVGRLSETRLHGLSNGIPSIKSRPAVLYVKWCEAF